MHISTNANKQSASVCVCDINSAGFLIGCKFNYCGRLTDHDLRKMRNSFTPKTPFRNIILGNTATLNMLSWSAATHTSTLPALQDGPAEALGVLLGSNLTASHFSVYISGRI